MNLEFFWNWILWNYSFISRFNYQGTTEVVGIVWNWNCFGIWNFLNLEFFEFGIFGNWNFFEFGIFLELESLEL